MPKAAIRKALSKLKNRVKPKIVSVNRPSSVPGYMQWLIFGLIFLLVAFSTSYIVKLVSPSYAAMYAEKFSQGEQPKPRVLLVKKDGCGACRNFQPVFDGVASTMPGVIFEQKLAEQVDMSALKVSAVPTTIVYGVNGQEDKRYEGSMSAEELVKLISPSMVRQESS